MLVQQGRGLQRRLARADHHHPLAGERGQVVCAELCVHAAAGSPASWRGDVGEVLHPDGQHHLAGPHLLAVGQVRL